MRINLSIDEVEAADDGDDSPPDERLDQVRESDDELESVAPRPGPPEVGSVVVKRLVYAPFAIEGTNLASHSSQGVRSGCSGWAGRARKRAARNRIPDFAWGTGSGETEERPKAREQKS